MAGILWQGSEHESFTAIADPANFTEGSGGFAYDSVYSRGCHRFNANTVFCTGDAGGAISPNYSSGVAIFWGQGITGAAGAGIVTMLWTDNGGVDRIRMIGTATAGQFTMQIWNGSSWVSLGSGTLTYPAATQGYFNFYFTGLGTASGSVTFQISGTTYFTATGVDFTGVANLRYTRWGTWGGRTDAAEFAIADVNLGVHRIRSITATALGTDVDDTGALADVTEFGPMNDSTYLELTAAGKHRSYKAAARTLSAPAYRGVTVTGRAMRVDATGPQQIKPYLLIGGTRYYGTTFALTIGFVNYQYTWQINPATSAAWTAADVNSTNLEWGWEAVT